VTGEHRLRPPAGQSIAAVSQDRAALELRREDDMVRVILDAGKDYRVTFV
jgi:hypothetical protein